jgi:hypothetical protein
MLTSVLSGALLEPQPRRMFSGAVLLFLFSAASFHLLEEGFGQL